MIGLERRKLGQSRGAIYGMTAMVMAKRVEKSYHCTIPVIADLCCLAGEIMLWSSS